MSEPIFQIIKPGLHIKIYANGRVEGIEGDYTIVNYIPFAITPDARERFSSKENLAVRTPDQMTLTRSL